jgi:predicted DNA-binding transcriptional regulator YafY
MSTNAGTAFRTVDQDQDDAVWVADWFAAQLRPLGEIVGLKPVDLLKWSSNEIAGWNREAIAVAITNQEAISFDYKGEERHVHPRELYQSDAGDELVESYDSDRDDIRSFRLDRIEGYVVREGLSLCLG